MAWKWTQFGMDPPEGVTWTERFTLVDENGDLIMSFPDAWYIEGPSPEHARMIASVPRLLKALEGCLQRLDGGRDDAMCHLGICSREECAQCRSVDEAVAAIKEAREGTAWK